MAVDMPNFWKWAAEKKIAGRSLAKIQTKQDAAPTGHGRTTPLTQQAISQDRKPCMQVWYSPFLDS